MIDSYLERILRARVYDVAIESPLQEAKCLSRRLHNRVLFKREDLQPVFSFKLRGAYNKIAHLPQEALARGVICSSAGNHAQGVALGAERRGIEAVIVMPRTTPMIKVQAVRALGARVILHGDIYDDAYEHAVGLARDKGYTFIHPFDDPDVIAGQGTIALELLHQHPGDLDAVFIPIGGGGLAAGVSVLLRHIRPEVKLIGVEPEDAPSMYQAIREGRRVVLDQVGIFADGVAVRQVGEETFRICRQTLDDIILVNTDEICAAIKDIFDDTRSIVEPAGGLAVAGLKRYVSATGVRGGNFITLNCGANINFDRLRHVAERAEVGEQREALLAVTIPERPGSFRDFCRQLGRRAVTEFNYRYADPEQARVFVGVALSGGGGERQQIIAHLQEAGYAVTDMTDNEMAKLHVRYMVGGRTQGLGVEALYRFQFPERPGALLKFLNQLRRGWNISLFHYRNHGADYGRVLMGLQVPPGDRESLDQHLRDIGYPFWDESGNPAYRMFL